TRHGARRRCRAVFHARRPGLQAGGPLGARALARRLERALDAADDLGPAARQASRQDRGAVRARIAGEPQEALLARRLQTRHHALGEILDHPVLSVEWWVEHDLPQALAPQLPHALDQLFGRAARRAATEEVGREEAGLLPVEEAVVAAVQALVPYVGWSLVEPAEIGLPDRASVVGRLLARLQVAGDEIVQAGQHGGAALGDDP